LYNIIDLGKWFLNKSSMSHKKVQKLCYYAVAWHYALYDSKLVESDYFEAWVHGPVSPIIWNEYKGYGWTPIPKIDEKIEFDCDTEEFLEIVLNTYDEYSGHQLEALTHEEEPWQEARNGLEDCKPSNNLINPATMGKYYRSIYDHSQND